MRTPWTPQLLAIPGVQFPFRRGVGIRAEQPPFPFVEEDRAVQRGEPFNDDDRLLPDVRERAGLQQYDDARLARFGHAKQLSLGRQEKWIRHVAGGGENRLRRDVEIVRHDRARDPALALRVIEFLKEKMELALDFDREGIGEEMQPRS